MADEFEATGPVDSDEEKDAIMAAISRSRPVPLEQHVFVPTRRKYQYVRMKEMLTNALGGSRGSGLFATGDGNTRVTTGGHVGEGATSSSATFASPVGAGEAGGPGEGNRRSSLIQQAIGVAGKAGQGPPSRKASTASVAAGQ